MWKVANKFKMPEHALTRGIFKYLPASSPNVDSVEVNEFAIE